MVTLRRAWHMWRGRGRGRRLRSWGIDLAVDRNHCGRVPAPIDWSGLQLAIEGGVLTFLSRNSRYNVIQCSEAVRPRETGGSVLISKQNRRAGRTLMGPSASEWVGLVGPRR